MSGKSNMKRFKVNQNKRKQLPFSASPSMPHQQANPITLSGLQTPATSQLRIAKMSQQQINPASFPRLPTPSTSQFAVTQMNQQQANSTLFTGFPMSQFSNLQMFAPAPQFSMDQGQINQFATMIPAFMSFMNTMANSCTVNQLASIPGNFAIQGESNVSDPVSTIATTFDDETLADSLFDGTDGTDGTDVTEENSSESQNDTGGMYVEKIVGKRTIKGCTEYELKWQGCDSSKNTWTPANQMLNCQELIEQFERSMIDVKINNSHSGTNMAAGDIIEPEKSQLNIGKNLSKQSPKGNSFYEIQRENERNSIWPGTHQINQTLKLRLDELNGDQSVGKTDESSSFTDDSHSIRTHPIAQLKRKMDDNSPVDDKRRKLSVLSYETYDPTLTVQNLQRLFADNMVATITPDVSDQNYNMYSILRRLKRLGNDKIIPHFFRCEICETIMKINTVHNHSSLGRHLKKCSGSIQVNRSTFYQLVQALLEIGDETGSFNVSNVIFPSTINEGNICQCIKKVKAEAAKYESSDGN